MWSWSFETFKCNPLSVQRATPFSRAEMANIFRIDIFAPSISLAASFVNWISRWVIFHSSWSISIYLTSPIFSSNANTSLSINSLLFMFLYPSFSYKISQWSWTWASFPVHQGALPWFDPCHLSTAPVFIVYIFCKPQRLSIFPISKSSDVTCYVCFCCHFLFTLICLFP